MKKETEIVSRYIGKKILKGVKLNFIFLVFIAFYILPKQTLADGCSNSRFILNYSPLCGCFQFCDGGGNASVLISDCNSFNSLIIDWGDGSPSYSIPIRNGRPDPSQLPCHHYAPGTYTATLRIDGNCHIFGNNRCTASNVVTVTQPTLTFDANFRADTLCQGFGVTSFTNLSVFGPELVNRTWYYDFGDGTISQGNTQSHANPVHFYDSCGAYDVMLIITAQTLCCPIVGRDTIIKRVYVNCPPNAQSNALGRTDPYIYESSASLTMNEVCLGDATNFVLNKHDSIISWLYTYADGGSSTLQNPTHTYQYCPPFVSWVNVELTNTRGCKADLLDTALVNCPVLVNVAGVTGTLCTGDCNGTASINITGGTPNYTIQWGNGQSSLTAVNLCPDDYSVTVTDSKGCWDSLTLNVFSPDPFIGVINSTDIECNGWLAGTAVLTVSGGTSPNAYYWSPGGATTPIASGLAPGTYCVTASDANGCSFTDCTTINEPPPITATTSSVGSACGACDGSASVTASGGTLPNSYNYLWGTLPPQNTQTATGLCSGVYYVEVEDANVPGCVSQFSVPVGNVGAEPVAIATVDISCSNTCDGSATATPATCTNCEFEWLDANGILLPGSAATITGLCAGIYISRVTDPVTGCQSLQNFTISALNPVTANATPTGISCVGECDGQISVAAGGGTGNFQFQWFNSSNTQIPGNNATITALCPGVYFVQVTDLTTSCTARDTAVVGDHFFTGNRTIIPISCNGVCNASITATATGTNPPFTFIIQNGSGTTVNSGAIAANLCPDTYTVFVTDMQGCTLALPPAVITEPAAIVPVTSATPAACFGDCDGIATVTASGGTPGYTYQWADASLAPLQGATSSTLSNLCAGTYNVQARDANNCPSPWVPVVIAEPLPLQSAMNITQPHCGNNGLGCIDLAVSGGTGPNYGFSWSGPNSFTSSNEDICDLPVGQYSVIIIDQNSCVLADAAVIFTSPQIELVSISKIGWMEGGQTGQYDIRCYGDSTGIVVVNITGGVPPYTYQWNDPYNSTNTTNQTDDAVFLLPAGVYTVNVTDATGCDVDAAIDITQPPPLTLTYTTVDNLCPGDSIGSITLNVSGGVTPPTGYLARWIYETDTSRHIHDTTTQISGLLAGVYTVAALDSYMCSARDTITINEPPLLQTSLSVINGSCAGSGDGTITLTVTGGEPFTASDPYIYSWTWSGGSASTKDLSGLAPGTYYVVVTDSNNCVAYDTAVVIQPIPLSTTISATPATCFGGSDGSVTVVATGGSPAYNYIWNLSPDNAPTLTGIPSGDYSVTVIDQGLCRDSISIFVPQPLPITGTASATRCVGDSIFLEGGWRYSDGSYYDTLITSIGCDSVLRTDLRFVDSFLVNNPVIICHYETYAIGLSNYNTAGTFRDVLISSGGCDSIVITDLSVYPPIGLEARPEIDTFRFGVDAGIQVDIINNPGINIDWYDWTPRTGLNCWDCSSNIIVVNEDTRYEVVAYDGFCYDTTTVTIIFDAAVAIYIPNAFTPNGDGMNDIFYVYGEGFTKFLLKIFDRWGELIFESDDQNVGWDGTFRGKPLNPGVFVYYVDIEFITGQAPPEYNTYRKGSLTLIR